MSTRHLRTAGALFAAVALLTTACSAGSGTIGLVAEPASLDFGTTDGAAIPQALLDNVYEGLVKLDQDGKVVPDLAKSWDISSDRKTYTFHLVDNAKFTDGHAFTATDA